MITTSLNGITSSKIYSEIPLGVFYGKIGTFGPGLFFKSRNDVNYLTEPAANWAWKSDYNGKVEQYREVDLHIEVKFK